MKKTADVEVWAQNNAGAFVMAGKASTIRGVRQMIKRTYPNTKRIMLRGTADALDRANGLGFQWHQWIDLVTRDVPIKYVIVKESP